LKIDTRKLDLVLAAQCKNTTDLRGVLNPATITRIRKGQGVGTKTAGKLAKALNVPIEQLVESQEGVQ